MPSAAQPKQTNGDSAKANEKEKQPEHTSSSSDDDIPLASLAASLTSPMEKSTPVMAALVKAEKAMVELRRVYEKEIECIKGQLAERDLLIDQLRAKLRTRPSRKAAGSSSS